MSDRRGMTLIEMLIAITVFSIVLGGALGFLSKQSKGMDRNSADMGMLQNLSFAGALLEQEVRMAGANVPFKQPAVLYAGHQRRSSSAPTTPPTPTACTRCTTTRACRRDR